jgi:hypothetical protein
MIQRHWTWNPWSVMYFAWALIVVGASKIFEFCGGLQADERGLISKHQKIYKLAMKGNRGG